MLPRSRCGDRPGESRARCRSGGRPQACHPHGRDRDRAGLRSRARRAAASRHRRGADRALYSRGLSSGGHHHARRARQGCRSDELAEGAVDPDDHGSGARHAGRGASGRASGLRRGRRFRDYRHRDQRRPDRTDGRHPARSGSWRYRLMHDPELVKVILGLQADIAAIKRMVAGNLRFGTVKKVDHEAKRAQLLLSDANGREFLSPLRPWAEIAGDEKSWRPPTDGQQMMLVASHGDMRQAVLLPMTFSDQSA
ncbi:hypothetical protein EN759_30235, partial [Mesorhizobium sp. M00.F.Ca.ET.038.03.1.1]